MVAYILDGITVVALLISVVTDLRERKIFNKVTYPAMVIGLVAHGIIWGWDGGLGMGLKWSFIGFLVGGIPFFLMNAFDPRAFGGGDVKLMAAVGALQAFPVIVNAWLYTALCGGVLAIAVLLWQGKLLRTVGGFFTREKREGAGDDALTEGSGGGASDPHESGAAEPSDVSREGDVVVSEKKDAQDPSQKRVYVPYGVAIAGGTLWAIAVEVMGTGFGS